MWVICLRFHRSQCFASSSPMSLSDILNEADSLKSCIVASHGPIFWKPRKTLVCMLWKWQHLPLHHYYISGAGFHDHGPFMEGSYIFVIDVQSNWVEVEELSSTTPGKTQDHWCNFATYGIPEHLVSNN